MKPGTVVVTMTTAGCAGVLAASIFPGLLTDLLFLACLLLPCIILPGFVLAAAWILLGMARRGTLKNFSLATDYAPIAFWSVVATLPLLFFKVPCRLAFAASRPAFEQVLSEVPETSDRRRPLNRRCGFYTIDEYGADSRGGVYFRVGCGADGMGPDQMSYGFVHSPNSRGTPFGAKKLKTFWVGGDWYSFRASNDWH